MNAKYMFVVAAMAVMLVGATALATDSAFADGKKKYGKNQAIGQTNACGNGDMPMYVFCQNTGSQVQGEKNAVALDGAQQSEEDRRGGGHDGGYDNGDSGAVAPDSGAAAPDSGAVAPDSGAAAPDSGAAAPDSGAAAPDSGAAAPDSGAGDQNAAAPPADQNANPLVW
jgi:hypothetical protein